MNAFLHRLIFFTSLALAMALGQKAYADQDGEKPEPNVLLTDERFLLDPNSSYSIEDVMEMEFDDSEEDAYNLLKKLNPNRALWIRVNAENNSSLFFDGYIYSNVCSERTYYWIENDSLYKNLTGLLHPDEDDVIFFERYLTPITLEPGEQKTIYIKSREFVRYPHGNPVFTGIAEKDGFNSFVKPAGTSPLVNLHVFFNGLLIFQLLYILIQWSLVRRIEYFYYALYIVSIFAYFWPRHVIASMSIDGIEVPIAHFVANANDILLVLPTFFYFRFSRHFIDMPLHKPVWNKIIKGFEYTFLALTVMVALTNTIIPNDLPKDAIVMSCIVVQFVLTIVALRGFFSVETLTTRFILTAGIIALTAHVFSITLSIFNIYPSIINIAPIAVTMVGIIIEIAIFNSGLLFKGKEVEKDKFKAQMKFLKEVEAKQKIELEYAGVRDKIARDLHDDIGSTLSSVSIYSYAAKSKLANGNIDEAKDLIASIEKNALTTLNSMGDLVWAITPSNDSTEKLLERINSFGYEILSAKECSFEMTVDPLFYEHNSNLEQRRSLLLICKEALNNAAKYSGASKVQLKITPIESGFRIIISDNGEGFDIDKIKTGNGLGSMKFRASTLSDFFEISSTKNGTVVAFNI